MLNFIQKIVKKAGSLLLKSQSNFQIVKQKDILDIATTADIASEDFLIKSILNKFPNHGILSEERGEINPKSPYKWVIDPLDGTKEFIKEVPLWNCSVCLDYNNETIAAAIYMPQEDVLYSAVKGVGSFKNKQKIKVSSNKSLKTSFVYCYLPSYKRQQEKYDWAFKKLSEVGKKAYRLRALANENTALCWLAQGGCEAYLNLSNPPKYHDIAPGLFVAKMAGATNVVNNIPLIVATNEVLYNKLIKIIL